MIHIKQVITIYTTPTELRKLADACERRATEAKVGESNKFATFDSDDCCVELYVKQ